MAAGGYQNLLRRYSGYARIYDRRWARYSEETLGRTLIAIPAASYPRVHVDVACGTGLLAAKIRERWPQATIIGVDVTQEMLEKARQRLPEDRLTQWRQGQAEQLPVESGIADVVTCTNAFHLVQDAPAALAEIHRVLKPGGTLVIVDWSTDKPSMRWRAALMKLVDRHPRHLRRVDELAILIQQAGFSIELRDQFTAPGHWGMLVVRARAAATPAPDTPLQGSRKSLGLSAGTV